MKLRTFLLAIAILGTVWHPAAAQPKKAINIRERQTIASGPKEQKVLLPVPE
jgi:hypothetical protein